jgi:8-oxo-dGTP pyrophosphatase MutT (NUDIX family)
VTARAPLPREEVSAGGVVVRRVDGVVHFLLIRDPYKHWGFPKGHLEQGESPEQAACREVAEETGVRVQCVLATLDCIDWHFRFRGRLVHKTCHFFLMETRDDATAPQQAEGITACRWAPYEDALRLVSYENARVVLRQAQAFLSADGVPAP